MQSLETSIPPPITPQHDIKKGKLFVTDFTITIPGSNARNMAGQEPGPSKWRTLEFRLYILVFILVVPMLIWVPMKVSLRESKFLEKDYDRTDRLVQLAIPTTINLPTSCHQVGSLEDLLYAPHDSNAPSRPY